jgi:hypothetical protein
MCATSGNRERHRMHGHHLCGDRAMFRAHKRKQSHLQILARLST